MGTRSLTTFIETWKDEKTQKQKRLNIVTMYRQFDGYPEGHGIQLANFLSSGKMVNGFSNTDEKQFNGMGCLAAQVIAYFKTGVGGFYLHRGGTKNCWEDYRYEVIFDQDTKELTMTCYYVHSKKYLFKGKSKDFKTILKTT
jgi:hypothetical protein